MLYSAAEAKAKLSSAQRGELRGEEMNPKLKAARLKELRQKKADTLVSQCIILYHIIKLSSCDIKFLGDFPVTLIDI